MLITSRSKSTQSYFNPNSSPILTSVDTANIITMDGISPNWYFESIVPKQAGKNKQHLRQKPQMPLLYFSLAGACRNRTHPGQVKAPQTVLNSVLAGICKRLKVPKSA